LTRALDDLRRELHHLRQRGERARRQRVPRLAGDVLKDDEAAAVGLANLVEWI
jgi:hypothetical protein